MAARALGARAFTRKGEIYFGAGQPDARTRSGAELLTHERVHVAQQRRAGAPVILRDPDPTEVSLSPLWVQGLSDDELWFSITLLQEFLRDREECSVEIEVATQNLRLLEGEVVGRGLESSDGSADEFSCFQEEEPEAEGNVWPFVGASAPVVERYIDNHVTSLAVNLMLGQLVLGIEGREERINALLTDVDDSGGEVLPIWPVVENRAAAMAIVTEWEPHTRPRNLKPVVVFEGTAGLLWPTHIGPRTTPRIWSVYPAAMEEALQGIEATRDAFVQLAFWYVGARYPVRTRTSPATAPARTTAPAAAAADIVEGFSAAETVVIREAQGILGSSEFATIRAAHAAGETTSVTVGGRLIQYQADFTYAEAMTLGREGFVMGPRAFVSEAEATRTVLHELHRLNFSSVVATGEASAAAAGQTTRAAWTFAEEAWQAVFAGAP